MITTATHWAAPLAQLRARLGAKWTVVLLTLPVCAYGSYVFGPRAAAVVALSVTVCVLASVLPRALCGEHFRWLNSGTVVTGILLGLTMSASTPWYMVIVGGLVAELLGKTPLPALQRPLFNSAALGRGAVALLEVLDPPSHAADGVDTISSASPLMVTAGGASAPRLWNDLLLGFSKGAIGERGALLLIVVASLMLSLVVLKRHAPLALLFTAPVLVAFMPATPAVLGHAPWVLQPIVYLTGGSTLMMATFFATDPVTTPQTRSAGVVFGAGAATLGVLGRLYTSIPGCEMWGVLVMNALTPLLDRWARQWSRRRLPLSAATDSSVAERSVSSFYSEHDKTADHPSVARASAAWLDATGARDYAALQRALGEDLGEQLLADVERAQLLGCGGARFPVAAKWRMALAQPAPRVLVINGQEGEPNTFKDRELMQRAPEAVLQGAALAALALEASELIVVIKGGYESQERAMSGALERLRARVPRLPFEVRLQRGPTLYVCGEETALLEYLEGRRGEPRVRPPFPSERGLFGRPTVVHNVETAYWIAHIAEQGPATFAHGVPKLVSLSGELCRPGVYPVTLGTKLSEVVALGGGLIPGHTLKALLVGGPAGALLRPEHLDCAYEPRALAALGAAIGSGALRVLSTRCLMLEVADAAAFMARESCGRCTPCRAGTEELR